MTPNGMRAITIPQNHREAMASAYSEHWKAAEEREIDAVDGMDTYGRG